VEALQVYPYQVALTKDFQNTQGIIFVVDSNDRERITEAREERESTDPRPSLTD
jgi:hypothetical protein